MDWASEKICYHLKTRHIVLFSKGYSHLKSEQYFKWPKLFYYKKTV